MGTSPMTDLPEQDLINALGRLLVADMAPAELPLFSAMVQARAAGASHTKGGEHNDLLGFGLGEAIALMTPLILQFSQMVWLALNEHAAQASLGLVGGVLHRLKDRLGLEAGNRAEVKLTDEELRYVREVGRRCAANLEIDAGQQELLVESLVGALAVPVRPAAIDDH